MSQKKITKKVTTNKITKLVPKKVDVIELDPRNIDSYECKGDVNLEKNICKSCPVLNSCCIFRPFYEIASNFGVYIGDKSVKTIIAEIVASAFSQIDDNPENPGHLL